MHGFMFTAGDTAETLHPNEALRSEGPLSTLLYATCPKASGMDQCPNESAGNPSARNIVVVDAVRTMVDVR